MKYIVTKTEEGKEEIFIFPKSINHDCMMEALRVVRTESKDGSWTRLRREAIAAGFTCGRRCVGRSVTLNLDSRGRLDEMLIDPNG